MKIEIVHYPKYDKYYAKIYDGPDGIDVGDFVCASLGECFEDIIKWRARNAMNYQEND